MLSYFEGYFFARAVLEIRLVSVPLCVSCNGAQTTSGCLSTGKADTFLFFLFMTKNPESPAPAKNERLNQKRDVTDVQKSATEFVKSIRKKHPRLWRLRIRQCENVWWIRARYGDRSLYACSDTLEEAFIHFFHEINQKVLLQPYRDRATVRAGRRMNAL